jgi:yeast amino acid transporter
MCSINAAAQGNDETITNKDNPQVRQLYDRQSPHYPYKSHGQYLRAWYALIGCALFILFNGWRTFVSPMSLEDFFGCYVGVS